MVNSNTHMKSICLLLLLLNGAFASFGCTEPPDNKNTTRQEKNAPVPHQEPTLPAIVPDTPVQETSFTVNNGKVGNCKTAYKSCHADFYFVTSAFTKAAIAPNGLNYQVTVYRTATVWPDTTSGTTGIDSLRYFYYVISSPENKQSPAEQFSREKQPNGKSYRVQPFTEYKAPVTCYYFVEKNKLVLLTYSHMPIKNTAVAEGLIEETRKLIP